MKYKSIKDKWISLNKLNKVFIFVLLMSFVIAIFCMFRLSSYQTSSREVFWGSLYRGKVLLFIHDNEKAKEYLALAVKKYNSAEAECDLGEIYAEEGNYKLATLDYLGAAMYGSQRCEVHFLKLSFPDEEKTFQF